MIDSKDSTNIEINGLKIPEETINNAYQDIVHPAGSEIGKLIAKPFSFVNWITDCTKDYFIGGKDNTNKLQEKVQKKLETIPPDDLCEPAKNIAIPAIIANSYTDDDYLRLLYANLIANSMYKRFQCSAHPSFVEVIKQLTPNEALFLKTTQILQDYMPICQIRFQKRNSFDFVSNDKINEDRNLHPNHIVRMYNEGYTIYHYYMPYIQSVPVDDLQIMIENFLRLNLIVNPKGDVLSSKNAYSSFYKDDFNKSLEDKHHNHIEHDYELAHILGLIRPTKYGERFYEICVK